MKLTEQQIAFFKTFGYLHFPGLFADDIGRISDTFESIFAERGGGHHGQVHDYKQRSSIVPFIDQHPYFCALIDDPRIEGLAGDILGYDFNYSNSDGNFYVGDTGWHSDLGHASPYLTMKIAFYLDEVTRDSGCLRVIPGSHTSGDSFAGTLNDMMPSMKEFTTEESLGVAGQDIPAAALESTPGDLVSSTAASSTPPLAEAIEDACSRWCSNSATPKTTCRSCVADRYSLTWWMERAYGPTMIETAGPGRMVHLEQRLSNDGHLAELTRKAREEMAEPSRGSHTLVPVPVLPLVISGKGRPLHKLRHSLRRETCE